MMVTSPHAEESPQGIHLTAPTSVYWNAIYIDAILDKLLYDCTLPANITPCLN